MQKESKTYPCCPLRDKIKNMNICMLGSFTDMSSPWNNEKMIVKMSRDTKE